MGRREVGGTTRGGGKSRWLRRGRGAVASCVKQRVKNKSVVLAQLPARGRRWRAYFSAIATLNESFERDFQVLAGSPRASPAFVSGGNWDTKVMYVHSSYVHAASACGCSSRWISPPFVRARPAPDQLPPLSSRNENVEPPGGKSPPPRFKPSMSPSRLTRRAASFGDGRVRGGGGVRRPAHRRRLGRLECGPHPAAAAVGTVRRSRGRAERCRRTNPSPRGGGPWDPTGGEEPGA